MSLIPGTTPTITLELDTSITSCAAAKLNIVAENVIIQRKLDELTISEDGTLVSARLTQAETLLLPNNRYVRVQLRVLLHDAAMATDIMTVPTKELLCREELLPDAD